MSHSLYERIDRLRSVERQFWVASHALSRLRVAVLDGRATLPARTSMRDLDAAEGQLESTYLVRLWAEFETALRSYYGFLQNDPDTQIRAMDLVNYLGALRRGRAVSDQVRILVHEVREYRNLLVHERDEPTKPIALEEARSRLNAYLGGKLPERWG